MVIEPKILHNVCLTAHPLGCSSQVRDQIDYIKKQGLLEGTKRALIIGSSNGYGLAARILAAYACGADTVGVAFERPGTARAADQNDPWCRDPPLNLDIFSIYVYIYTTLIIHA